MTGSPAEVLALHGAPGSGKSTLARAMALRLAVADIAWGVVDMDDISTIHPYQGHGFALRNLQAIWPNYLAAVPEIKLIIPTVLADEEEVQVLRDAVPGARLIVCELVAPIDVVKERVTAREPTEEARVGLRRWVDLYHSRSDHERIRDFQVSTHPDEVDDSARNVLRLAEWM